MIKYNSNDSFSLTSLYKGKSRLGS